MPTTKKDKVIIYTDGACSPNPGPGGWAAILLIDGKERVLTGSEPATTNNRMELVAAIKALEYIQISTHVEIYTDSEYVKKGITEWIPLWIERNWRRKKGKLKNVDLWKELHAQSTLHTITWHWVKGHAGNKYNNKVDRLAFGAIGGTKV